MKGLETRLGLTIENEKLKKENVDLSPLKSSWKTVCWPSEMNESSSLMISRPCLTAVKKMTFSSRSFKKNYLMRCIK